MAASSLVKPCFFEKLGEAGLSHRLVITSQSIDVRALLLSRATRKEPGPWLSCIPERPAACT